MIEFVAHRRHLSLMSSHRLVYPSILEYRPVLEARVRLPACNKAFIGFVTHVELLILRLKKPNWVGFWSKTTPSLSPHHPLNGNHSSLKAKRCIQQQLFLNQKSDLLKTVLLCQLKRGVYSKQILLSVLIVISFTLRLSGGTAVDCLQLIR